MKKLVKILFLGTSEFSKHCLRILLSDPQFQVEAVVTKFQKLKSSPVYILAEQNNIKIFTPSSSNQLKSASWISTLNVDIAVMAGYGIILPPAFLKNFHTVNIHASLLPKWRGAAPIQHCLLAGDKVTGLTLQKTEKKMDTGDIIYQICFPISEKMSAIDILEKMKFLSQNLLCNILPLYLKKEIEPISQKESEASYAPKIEKKDLKVDWSFPASSIFNRIRALVLNGGVYTFYKKKRLKIFKSAIIKERGPAGSIIGYDKEYGLKIACGKDAIALLEVQMEGRKRQNIHTFMRGFRIQPGEKMK